jgi:ankyrin repeat protein
MEIDGQRRTLTDPDEIRAHLGHHPDDEYAQRLATAQYLVENGLDINAEIHERQQTVLHRAADLGVPEIVELLLGTGQIDVDHQDSWGTAALHYACRGGHLPVVRQLVEAGANVNVQENYGYTPLHEAAENGHLEVVELLLEHGSDPSLGLRRPFQDYAAGATALDMARAKRHSKVVRYLETQVE